MLENLSVEAQHVVSLATAEAQRLHHPRIGTEHLLVGVLLDDGGEPAGVLRAAGVTLSATRHKVIEALGVDAGLSSGDPLPFTPRARRALERAGRFSRKEQAPLVSPGHVLLGVLDVEGVACQVLRGLGVDIDNLRGALVTTRESLPAALVEDPPSITEVMPLCPRCRSPLEHTLRETLIPARRDDGPTTNVSVLSCGACGSALGVLRPD